MPLSLQTLLLHRNSVSCLRGCDRLLPSGLDTLTLNDNAVADLTDLAALEALRGLQQLTLANNAAVEYAERQFDYRPYAISRCLGLRVLDGVLVSPRER
jgi:hypothetical protein